MRVLNLLVSNTRLVYVFCPNSLDFLHLLASACPGVFRNSTHVAFSYMILLQDLAGNQGLADLLIEEDFVYVGSLEKDGCSKYKLFILYVLTKLTEIFVNF